MTLTVESHLVSIPPVAEGMKAAVSATGDAVVKAAEVTADVAGEVVGAAANVGALSRSQRFESGPRSKDTRATTR